MTAAGPATPQLAMNYFSGYVEGWVAGAKGQVILNKDIVCKAAREVSEQILADTKTPSH